MGYRRSEKKRDRRSKSRRSNNRESKRSCDGCKESCNEIHDALYCALKNLKKKILSKRCYCRKCSRYSESDSQEGGDHCYKRPVYLTNEDFVGGTYRIQKSGIYVLAEDIVFNPNADPENPNSQYAYRPRPDQPEYQEPQYLLGFFAGITVETKDVYIDLNGYTFSSSQAFALQQRFWAPIELAAAPFISGQGPGFPPVDLRPANRCVVTNGKIGLSSHHSIRGNSCKNVLIENVTMRDFEVAALDFNGVKNMIFKELDIGPDRKDIPVLGDYSSGRFGLQFADLWINTPVYNEMIADVGLLDTLIAKTEELRERMDAVFNETVNDTPVSGLVSDPLFANFILPNGNRVSDGNHYGILVNAKGVAVEEFAQPNNTPYENLTRNIFIKDVFIHDLEAKINEIVGFSLADGTSVQKDVAGAVIQTQNFDVNVPPGTPNRRLTTTLEGVYIGSDQSPYNPDWARNSLVELQLVMGEIKNTVPPPPPGGQPLPTGTLAVDPQFVEWSKGNPLTLQDLIDEPETDFHFVCNVDTMFHLDKGTFGVRVDGTKCLQVHNVSIENVTNYGYMGNDVLCGNYAVSPSFQTRPGYRGALTNGINLSYCIDVDMERVRMKDLDSKNAECRGLRLINECRDVSVKRLRIKGIKSGTKGETEGTWVGTAYDGSEADYNVNLPNLPPAAIGIKLENRQKHVRFDKVSVRGLDGPSNVRYGEYKVTLIEN